MKTSHCIAIRHVVPTTGPLLVALVPSTLAMAGCTYTGGMQPRGEPILPPQQASVSPNYAPEKITKVAVFPLFATGTADDLLADRLVIAINSEVASRHSQWEIVSYRDLTRLITEHGLMTGFRNLEADHNTYSGPYGIMLLSPATQGFLKQLHQISGIDAILVGSYSFSTQTEPVPIRTLRGETIRYDHYDVNSVTLSLVYTPTPSSWWVATASRKGPPGQGDAVARAIAQTLASHIGRGTRRQL